MTEPSGAEHMQKVTGRVDRSHDARHVPVGCGASGAGEGMQSAPFKKMVKVATWPDVHTILKGEKIFRIRGV